MTTYNREAKTVMTTGAKFPWKKTVTWADQLETVQEFEKAFRKGSYGELSAKIGKPRRVLGKPRRVLGKPLRELLPMSSTNS
tara:strand:- start:119 stop:364 length:246 start_codon:yes stop_codon:yes gene_type:complete